jgi:hypothetical protein
MNLENLAEYLVPVILLVLYLVFNTKKKPPVRPHARKEVLVEREEVAEAPKRPLPLTPKRELLMPKPKVSHPPIKKASRAAQVLKKNSLRSAFLSKEILNRPYD